MKVICINDKYLKNSITIGKQYEVVDKVSFDSIANRCFYIIDDYDRSCWVCKSNFKTISEMRNEKINKLLK